MPLTGTAVKNAKPAAKAVKLFGGNGLYLEISPKGGKRWRLKYRLAGKEKRLSLGTYPETGLKAAREKREEARALIAQASTPVKNAREPKSGRWRQPTIHSKPSPASDGKAGPVPAQPNMLTN